MIVAESTLSRGCGTRQRAIRLSCGQGAAVCGKDRRQPLPRGYIKAPNSGGPTNGSDNPQAPSSSLPELIGSIAAARSSVTLADFLDRLFVSPGMRKRPQLGEVLRIPHFPLFSRLAPIDANQTRRGAKPR